MTITSDWTRLRNKLMRDLSLFFTSCSATEDRLEHYALVDAAQVPEMRSNTRLIERLHGVRLFSLTQEHGIEKYGPILIPLCEASDRNIDASLISAMRSGWAVSWLGSTLPLMKLAEHLVQYMNGRLADGREVLVRYYDPRVLPVFLEHAEKTLIEGLMAPIAHWAWWDRQMKFTSRVGDRLHFSAKFAEINISQQLQEAFSKRAIEDLIQGMLLEHTDKDEFASWLPQVLYCAVAKHVSAAQQIGLISISNIYLYVSLALRTHPRFFSLLALESKGTCPITEIDLPQLVLAVIDDDWNILSSDGKHEIETLRQTITTEICLDVEHFRGR